MHLLICFKKTQHGSCRLSVIRFAYYFEYSRSFEMRSNLLNQAVLEMVASFSFDWDVNKTWLVNTNGSRSHSILSAPTSWFPSRAVEFSAASILSNHFNCWALHHVLIFQYKPPCCYHTWFKKSNLLYSTSLIDYCNTSWVFK